MRENLSTYGASYLAGEVELKPDEDPFFEKREPILLGYAQYILEGLPYLMDNPRDIPIRSTTNEISGMLHMNIVPCDEHGNEELDEDCLPEEAEHILNQELCFKVKISHLTNLPEDFCENM